MAKRILIIIGIVILTLGYAAYQALELDGKLADQSIIQADSVVTNYPSVKFKYFQKENYLDVYKDFPGKRVVVHFWATWCGPCETEIPKFLTLFNALDFKNFVFLFVTVNDEAEKVVKFLKKFPELSKHIYLVEDNDQIHQQFFGTYKLPETYIFDVDMSLIRKFTGPQDWDSDYFRSFFDQYK